MYMVEIAWPFAMWPEVSLKGVSSTIGSVVYYGFAETLRHNAGRVLRIFHHFRVSACMSSARHLSKSASTCDYLGKSQSVLNIRRGGVDPLLVHKHPCFCGETTMNGSC